MYVGNRTMGICARYGHNAYILCPQKLPCLNPSGSRGNVHGYPSGLEICPVCIGIREYIRGGIAVLY